MRILLADDQPRVRFALRVLLMQQPGLQVVGEASDSRELFAQAGLADANLLLLDWELPGLTETDGVSALRRAHPALRIIVLSSRPGARRAAQAASVDAFVSKGDPPEQLLTVIRRCDTPAGEGGPDVTPK